MSDNDPKNWPEMLMRSVGSSLGVKVGPGVLLVVGWVAAAGMASAAVAVWALQSQPVLATAVVVLILLVVLYFCERAFRYAEKNPIPALMGGAELLKVIEHQIGAKNPSIVAEDQSPQLGGGRAAVKRSAKPKVGGAS